MWRYGSVLVGTVCRFGLLCVIELSDRRRKNVVKYYVVKWASTMKRREARRRNCATGSSVVFVVGRYPRKRNERQSVDEKVGVGGEMRWWTRRDV